MAGGMGWQTEEVLSCDRRSGGACRQPAGRAEDRLGMPKSDVGGGRGAVGWTRVSEAVSARLASAPRSWAEIHPGTRVLSPSLGSPTWKETGPSGCTVNVMDQRGAVHQTHS